MRPRPWHVHIHVCCAPHGALTQRERSANAARRPPRTACGPCVHTQRPFIKRFEECDVSNTGRITRGDLDQIYEADRAEQDQLLEHIEWSQQSLTRVAAYEREREERYDAKRQNYANLRRMLPTDASPLALSIRPARAFAAKWSQAASTSLAAVRLTKSATRALAEGGAGPGAERPSWGQGCNGKAKVLPHGPEAQASSVGASSSMELQDVT